MNSTSSCVVDSVVLEHFPKTTIALDKKESFAKPYAWEWCLGKYSICVCPIDGSEACHTVQIYQATCAVFVCFFANVMSI